MSVAPDFFFFAYVYVWVMLMLLCGRCLCYYFDFRLFDWFPRFFFEFEVIWERLRAFAEVIRFKSILLRI
jgi:hypothetical protein